MARASRGTVTLADVARVAGVSLATASFVLSGRAGARSAGSEETKAKVRAAAAELGYVPNRHAQAMRTGRGGGIVLALGTLDDPWGVQLATQVREDALAHDLSTLILADERWYEYLMGASADAALVTSIDFVDDGPERVRRLAASTQTGLIAFSARMEPERFDVVRSTPVPAIGRAYERLRARHRRVRLLAPELGRRPGGTLEHPRTRAFLDAAQAHGDGPGEDLLHLVPEGSRDTYLAGLEWMSGPDRPEAVICFTGYQAVALQLAAERAGLRIPEDLEFVAIGDVPAASEFFGPISYYGVDDVFARLSRIIVGRAADREDRPGALHTFDWEFFPGTTTRDPEESA
ncbi:LacI family DNA-binding transcriptional regulator [Brachybacterium saurashtrense]|uniref:LacI family transcriptional regulator n=1 Tax=Brachybacterium saurashtrense TaxID=556288 RepID=A0A345YJW5_9MICO|nr:LacI family DNA-binding transcriptional regulator [Brachybacterium saurashtrense]AXK44217.1 LacI family transcriptional regulator [Brachybacterium saurashtrense]RRR21489.1 LacI family transcriptional regulator [Brachybacterium saurashtrense]